MPTLNLGRVGFVNKGAYIGGTTDYKINDVTAFNNGIYACIQAHNTPHVPTVGGDAYWQEWVTQDNSAYVADAINSATSKTTTVDADSLGIVDSEASNVLKKLTFANLWLWIKSKADLIYRSNATIPSFNANGASQAFTATVITKFACATEVWDEGGAYYDNTLYRYQPQVAGKYSVKLGMNSTAGNYGAAIYLYSNGVLYRKLQSFTSAVAADTLSGTVDIQLNGTTDYIEAYGSWTSNNTAETFFQAHLIEGA